MCHLFNSKYSKTKFSHTHGLIQTKVEIVMYDKIETTNSVNLLLSVLCLV